MGLVGRENKEEDLSKKAEEWEMKENKSPWAIYSAFQWATESEGKRYIKKVKVKHLKGKM